MKYDFAPDIQELAEEISLFLFSHIDIKRIKCFRSVGISSQITIARCHTLGKLMQKAIGVPAVYALEFLAGQFERRSEEDKIKTIIHELMHIPNTFGGGFKHHNWVTEKNVDLHYETYKIKKSQIEKRKNTVWFSRE